MPPGQTIEVRGTLEVASWTDPETGSSAFRAAKSIAGYLSAESSVAMPVIFAAGDGFLVSVVLAFAAVLGSATLLKTRGFLDESHKPKASLPAALLF